MVKSHEWSFELDALTFRTSDMPEYWPGTQMSFNLGATGVFGVDKGDGDSGIDKVSHDNIESDLIELDNEP